MATSEARIRANQANSLKSTGPRTIEGKERSRENSYKHGLTGAGTVIPEREAVEVQRRMVAFAEELKPSGEVGLALVRRAAVHSVRMERAAEYETATLTVLVRKAEADFVPPEGVDATEAARLRFEAGKRALFDSSPEAILARRYEAAAERGFLRALKELRQMAKAEKAAESESLDVAAREIMASFASRDRSDDELDALFAEKGSIVPPKPSRSFGPVDLTELGRRVDVPISIGRRP